MALGVPRYETQSPRTPGARAVETTRNSSANLIFPVLVRRVITAAVYKSIPSRLSSERFQKKKNRPFRERFTIFAHSDGNGPVRVRRVNRTIVNRHVYRLRDDSSSSTPCSLFFPSFVPPSFFFFFIIRVSNSPRHTPLAARLPPPHECARDCVCARVFKTPSGKS